MDVDDHRSPYDSSDDEDLGPDEVVGMPRASRSRTPGTPVSTSSYAMRRRLARVTTSSGDVSNQSQNQARKSKGKARAAKPRATVDRRKQTQASKAGSITTISSASSSNRTAILDVNGNDPGVAQYAIHTAPPVRYQVAQGAHPARIPVLGPPMAADDEDEKLYIMTYNTEKGGTFLHCANMRTGTWDLMANILSSNPFSSGRLLPPCPWTDMVFVKADNTKLLLIIGARLYSGTLPFGIEPDILQILAIDVQTRTWSVLPTLGIGARQRYGHAAVVVDNAIYIFGGRRNLPEGSDLWMCDPEDICESFCVLKLDETSGQWSWKVKDAPYPSHVKLGFLMGALVIDLGGGRKKILLVKGLMGESWENPILASNFYLFDPVYHTFMSQEGTPGDFPGDVGHYHIKPLLPLTTGNHPNENSCQVILACYNYQEGFTRDKMNFFLYNIRPVEYFCLIGSIGEEILEGSEGHEKTFAGFVTVGDSMYIMGVDDETDQCYTFVKFRVEKGREN